MFYLPIVVAFTVWSAMIVSYARAVARVGEFLDQLEEKQCR
jgi:hypothetical protein